MIQDAIITAAHVAKFLYDTAQRVKTNKESCVVLARNIDEIGKMLQSLENDIDDNQHYIHAINEFEELIVKCQEFVSGFSNKDYNKYIQMLMHAVSARKNVAQFNKFVEEIDRMHTRLGPNLLTQQIFDRRRDREEERKERQEKSTLKRAKYFSAVPVYEMAKTAFENRQYDYAFKLFQIAAEKHYAKAYCALGNYYCRPEDTGDIIKPKSIEHTRMALAWFDRGIQAGHWRCEYQKGVLLENGTNGIDVDKQQAYQCYQHAASQNEEHAQRRCKELGLTW